MEIYIDNRQDKIEIDDSGYDLIKKVIKQCLLNERDDLNYEVSVSLVDNLEIQKLNREFRGVDSATDVLSFPAEDEFLVPIPLLGDIIISMEKALEQSKEYGHDLNREIGYLTAHSMFHLMGYDHMEEDEKKLMRQREKEVMKNLNLFKD